MNVIFAPEIAKGWLIVYMDNILITTQDDPKFHKEMMNRISRSCPRKQDSTDGPS